MGLAYLELCPPSLAELAAATDGPLRILPLFMSAGGHVQRDLAPLVQQLRREGREVEVLPALGEHPLILEAIVQMA